MISLGIESTAHTFGIGIVNEKKQVLANVRNSYSNPQGGMIPNELAEHHISVFKQVFKEALARASIKAKDIDIISFSQGPGIGHALRVGAVFARSLALLLDKPLIGVNHCIAHLEIGKMLTEAKDPVLLYVSGANTQIIAFESGKYRIFGETLDMGLGNFLDTFAREAGIGFPGGPVIDKLAQKGSNYIELPYVIKGMDISLGGILTNLKSKLNKYPLEDLCYSLQETVFSMILEATERAMAHTGKNELLLGGGVACNRRLQEMARIMAEERNAKCYVLPNEFNVDNGAMIAWLGLVNYKKGNQLTIEESKIKPYWRTDEV
ncbi:MAG: N6-L-threonylcarbamoyladenine synthase [Candidatus Woesearchaeota archaeon]|nr:N6-L-threonylcarbamoyladenine synthase [Candidatus Woesearchaeota archaeon]MDN5327961.1 N6-L-threonylcarbamoyladenine synthase [Candidatus Woesearchaeota archaeon]